VLACLVPPTHFLLNSAPYLAFIEEETSNQAVCLAIMNSLVFDWQARRFVETHMNFFVLEGLRLPMLDDEMFAALTEPAASLSAPDERFAEFADATDVDYGPLSAQERVTLRVEIDALMARAWDLTADELEVVLADFTEDAVPGEYRDAVRKRFEELG